MIIQVLHCPHCHGTDRVRPGKTRQGKQRYRCREQRCAGRTFLLEYAYAGQSPAVKQQIIEMAMNASRIRDTARVLHVSPTTVIKELKKKEPALHAVNQRVLATVSPEPIAVEIWRVDELEVHRELASELDEMWSYVAKKTNPRWLWHAINHRTGKVLAYVFGRRKDIVFLQLKALLEPFGITHYYTDGWGAYERHVEAEQHTVGKENTQKIESKHITLRTRIKRLVRRTICFSKTERMHDLVIGLFINRYEFGLQI
jgi:insertion element IS1 protein InsB